MKENKYKDCKSFQPELETLFRSNLQKLSSPLRLIDEFWTKWCLFFVDLNFQRFDSPIQADEVKRANKLFEDLFPGQLSEQLEEFISNPEEYQDRVQFYENSLNQHPEINCKIDQETSTLLSQDPIRLQEEYFLLKSVLQNQNLSQDHFLAVDLGTGNGRMAYRISEGLTHILSDRSFKVFGLDNDRSNLATALSKQLEKLDQHGKIFFFVADMLHTPLDNGSCLLCNASSAANLIPVYKRPFLLMEMVRILDLQGEGVLTGPTIHCSIESYIRYVLAERSEQFSSLSWLQRFSGLIRLGKLIDDMTKLRLDFSYLDTEDMFLALKNIECQILNWDIWPYHGDKQTGIFSGIHFQTTLETKKYVQQYSEFLAKQNSFV